MANMIICESPCTDEEFQRVSIVVTSDEQDSKIQDSPEERLQFNLMSWSSFEVENEWTSDTSTSDSDMSIRNRSIYSSGPGYEPAIASTSTGISCRSREKKRKLELEWDTDPYEYGWDSSPEISGSSSSSALEIASTSVKTSPTPSLYASSPLGVLVGKLDDPQARSATDAYKLPKLVHLYNENDGQSSASEDVPVQSLVCALGQSQLGSDELNGIGNEEMVMKYTTLDDTEEVTEEATKEAGKKLRKKCAARNKVTDKLSIRSGRWTTAEDKALVQGVVDYLGSRGLEPQPPSQLPTEQELDKSERIARDASAILTIINLQSAGSSVGQIAEHQSQCLCWSESSHEHGCLGVAGSDMELFDSIVDVSYVTNGEDTFEDITATSNCLVSGSGAKAPLDIRDELNSHSSVLPYHRWGVHHWAVPPALFSPLAPPQLKEMPFAPILAGRTGANRQIDIFRQPHFQPYTELHHLSPVPRFHGGACDTANAGFQHLGRRSQRLSRLPSPSRNPGLGISGGSTLFDDTIAQISYRLGYQQLQQELFPFNRYGKDSYQQQHHHQQYCEYQGLFSHNYSHPSTALSLPITPPFSASPSASPQTSVPEPMMSSGRLSPQMPFATCDSHTFDCSCNINSKNLHLAKFNATQDLAGGDKDHGVQAVNRQTAKSVVASTPIRSGTTSLAFPPLPASQREIPKTREAYITAISRAMSLCPWSVIASHVVPGRTGVQAQARWSEALDPQVKKGPWTAEEDALLLKGVQQSEKCWIWIADGIPGRTQRQCRTRWVQISSRQERNAVAMARAMDKTEPQVQVGGLPIVEMDTSSSSTPSSRAGSA
ncbi:hypothetical protein BGX26_010183 [Mortierella sp. AD094]|nr:hypothetical protein BGX26_010183 [Mortierella sp. AD094]